ncbi:uncharacterized protein LOC122655030 [Telopea speciosissima]|uniref:uncharacterized protein LOC122655030 n=1 Tax=Telopea speciosissima TaxID=54955 RepID=UPI001CC817BC|nr:uncharacterized protein LOC122655030 [Telopea speciosissima]
MKQLRERAEFEIPVEVIGKRPRTPALSELEDEDDEEMLLAEFFVEEETLMQVMKVLEEEINCSANANNGVSAMYSPPFSSFVTINGNEESCGPSFSDSSSTVMASFDISGINISYFMGPGKGFPFSKGTLDLPAVAAEKEPLQPEIEEVSVSTVSDEGMNNGCEFEVGEIDDEWLARVLSGAPFVEYNETDL